MKWIFSSLIAILCTLPMSVKAQMPRITSYDGGLDAYRKIRKEVYDTAKNRGVLRLEILERQHQDG